MLELSFHWNAIFKDGSMIRQFDEYGIEYRFQKVKDRFDDLAFFNLTNNKGIMFTVNLLEGIVGCGDLAIPYRETKNIKRNIRLIFFRRHKIEIIENNLEKSHNITYHLGFQYNDEKDNNHKIILIIDSEGNFIIEE